MNMRAVVGVRSRSTQQALYEVDLKILSGPP